MQVAHLGVSGKRGRRRRRRKIIVYGLVSVILEVVPGRASGGEGGPHYPGVLLAHPASVQNRLVLKANDGFVVDDVGTADAAAAAAPDSAARRRGRGLDARGRRRGRQGTVLIATVAALGRAVVRLIDVLITEEEEEDFFFFLIFLRFEGSDQVDTYNLHLIINVAKIIPMNMTPTLAHMRMTSQVSSKMDPETDGFENKNQLIERLNVDYFTHD